MVFSPCEDTLMVLSRSREHQPHALDIPHRTSCSSFCWLCIHSNVQSTPCGLAIDGRKFVSSDERLFSKKKIFKKSAAFVAINREFLCQIRKHQFFANYLSLSTMKLKKNYIVGFVKFQGFYVRKKINLKSILSENTIVSGTHAFSKVEISREHTQVCIEELDRPRGSYNFIDLGHTE